MKSLYSRHFAKLIGFHKTSVERGFHEGHIQKGFFKAPTERGIMKLLYRRSLLHTCIHTYAHFELFSYRYTECFTKHLCRGGFTKCLRAL